MNLASSQTWCELIDPTQEIINESYIKVYLDSFCKWIKNGMNFMWIKSRYMLGLCTWMLKSFKVRITSYKRALWFWETIWRRLWEGLNKLSMVMDGHLRARGSSLSISILNISSAIASGRNEGPWEQVVTSGPTISMSQMIMVSPTAFKWSYTSSFLVFVCNSFLIKLTKKPCFQIGQSIIHLKLLWLRFSVALWQLHKRNKYQR